MEEVISNDWFKYWPKLPESLPSSQALKETIISQQALKIAKAYVEYLRNNNKLVVDQESLDAIWG